MNEYRNIEFWGGKPIVEMTKEELIAVVIDLGRMLQVHQETTARAFERLRELRKPVQ